jgi:hypothetical protein
MVFGEALPTDDVAVSDECRARSWWRVQRSEYGNAHGDAQRIGDDCF